MLLRANPGPLVLLHRDVEIRPAEAKRADRGATRVIRRTQPRPRLGVQVERAVFDIDLRIRIVHFDGGRQNPVVQRKSCLEQAGGSSCGLGVSDLRLHRTQCAPLLLCGSRREDLAQPFKLGRVARHRAGAVRFHHPDRFRTVSRRFVAAAQSLRLALGNRGVNRLRAPVRR